MVKIFGNPFLIQKSRQEGTEDMSLTKEHESEYFRTIEKGDR